MSIFISYSHDDPPVVQETITLLELAFPDKKVFWDKRLLGGDVLDNELRQEVRFSQAFVFFASNNSMHSDSYCQRELNWARTYDTHIIPYCISAAPEDVADHLGDDNVFCIDARTRNYESFAQLCGSVFRAVTPYNESHRMYMYLLYKVLNELDNCAHQEAIDVYERGYELDYRWTPKFEPPMSEKQCREVVDILSMLDRLQQDWNGLSEEEKSIVNNEIENSDHIISRVGFWANEEGKQLGYLRFLREHGSFTSLTLANNTGNSHGFVNLPKYRKMLQSYNHLMSDERDLVNFDRTFAPNEFVKILQEYRN